MLLVGDLGAGKTVFAQGFAAALGVAGPVTSPTFALVRHYRCGEGSPVGNLIHADVYRTGSVGEVADLALAELVEEDAVALVEWGDLAAPALGESALEVTLEVPDAARVAGAAPRDHRGSGALGGPVRGGGGGARAGGRGESAVSAAAGVAPPAIVAIETATETVGVAVRTPAGVQAEFALTGRRRHVETLTPAAPAPAGPGGVGPGRPGRRGGRHRPGALHRFARRRRGGQGRWRSRSASASSGRPASTSSRPGRPRRGTAGLVLACVDARRGEVFAAVHELDATGVVAAEPVAARPVRTGRPGGRARSALGGVAGAAVGDGALPLRRRPGGRARRRGDGARPVLPAAGALLGLALARLEAGEPPVDPGARRSPVHARGGRNEQLRPRAERPEAVPS